MPPLTPMPLKTFLPAIRRALAAAPQAPRYFRLVLPAPAPGPDTITAAAQQLGVTRTHLSLVIHGHRQSRSLTARYTALKQSA